MQKKQNTQINEEELTKDVGALLEDTKKLDQKMNQENTESEKKFKELETSVDESIKKIDVFCSDLDTLQKETADELEKIMLEESATFAKD